MIEVGDDQGARISFSMEEDSNLSFVQQKVDNQASIIVNPYRLLH